MVDITREIINLKLTHNEFNGIYKILIESLFRDEIEASPLSDEELIEIKKLFNKIEDFVFGQQSDKIQRIK